MRETLPGSGRGLLRAGAALLGAVVLAAVAGPWLYRADGDAQLDPAVAQWQPPGSSFVEIHLREGGALLADRVHRTPDGLAAERLGGTTELRAADVLNLTADGVADRARFPLGTDRLGRDVLARLLLGMRTSLLVGLLAVVIGLVLGLLVGGLAAGFGGWVDAVLMRAVDALLCFPQLVLVLALAALFGPSLWLVVAVLGATCWMPIARLARAEMAAVGARDFVTAARGLGAGRLRILVTHLLPNAWTQAVVAAGLLVGDMVLSEATLSFLGLGVQPPTPSWGAMIAEARDGLPGAWWGMLFPGAALVVTVIACNLLADGLRDAADRRGGASLGVPASAAAAPEAAA